MPEDRIRQVIHLPPDETVEFFRAKGGYPISRRWWDVWQEEHARSFTVAGVTDLEVLKQVRATLDTVVSEGGTFEMWKKDTLKSLRAAVEAGTAPPNILSKNRLRTIYQTNLRMARAAGQWKRIEASKDVMPFLKYSAIDDNETRPLHRLWGGLDGGKPIILPVDHPAWDFLYPPNGWGCRCNIIQLSARDLRDGNLQVTTEEALRLLGLPTSDMSDDELRLISREFIRSDGIVEQVPDGIDPGFGYNVGKEHFRGLSQSLTKSIETVAATDGGLPVARAVLEDYLTRSIWTAFLDTPGSTYPVMVLDEVQTQLLGSKARVVWLSSQTYAKNMREHPEIGIAEYRKLLDIGAEPIIVPGNKNNHVVFFKAVDGRWLEAVVKTTTNRAESYVQSLHYVSEKEVRAEQRKAAKRG